MDLRKELNMSQSGSADNARKSGTIVIVPRRTIPNPGPERQPRSTGAWFPAVRARGFVYRHRTVPPRPPQAAIATRG